MNWHKRPGTIDESIIEHVYTRNGYGIPTDLTGKLFIDVGAHIGSASVLAAERGATVWAYEPDSENYELLRKNIESSGLEISPFWYAFAPDKFVKLYKSTDNTGGHTIISSLASNKEDYKVVPTTTLTAELGNRFCEFLKLDCEGCEIEVIKEILLGGLHSQIKTIALEFHKSREDRELSDKLYEFYNMTYLGWDEYRFEHKDGL